MKKPNLFLFITLGFLLKIYAFFKGQKFIKKTKIKGPAITLSNHTSFYDFIYTTTSIYPRRMTYLAASKMFYEKGLKFFLRLARAIPKSLMQADPGATRKALTILKKGGILSIFPEGQISPSGKTLKPAYAIAKLIKIANVDVYIIKHQGAGIVNPPWTKKTFRGAIETHMYPLITKEDTQTFSVLDIYNKIQEELTASQSAFVRSRNYVYRVHDIHGLENVIYQCPVCFHEGLVALHKHLHCPQCDFRLDVDQTLCLNNRGIDEWFFDQANRLKTIIDDNRDFVLSSEVEVFSFRQDMLMRVGEGLLTLDKDQYRFDGVIDQTHVTHTFLVKNIPTLPSDIGRNIQIYEHHQIYQFVMKTPYLPTKFVHAAEYLFEKAHQ